MGGVKRAMMRYEDALSNIESLKNIFERITAENKNYNSNYTYANIMLSKIESYLRFNDALTVNSEMLEALELLSPQEIYENIQSEKYIQLIYNKITTIYNNYIGIILELEINSRIKELDQKYIKTNIDLSEELDKTRKEILNLAPQTENIKSELKKSRRAV